MTSPESISETTVSPAESSAPARSTEGGSQIPDLDPATPTLAERVAEYFAEKASDEAPGPSASMTSVAREEPTEHGDRFRPRVVRGSLAVRDSGPVPGPISPIASAAAALKRLLAAPSLTEELAVQASKSLRDAAVKSSTQSPRHAALALVLSDALAFTTVEEFDPGSDARAALLDGYRVLLTPFVAGESEDLVVRELLEAGWNLTPAFAAGTFKELDPEAFE
jgi:hypothetical protein